MAGAKILKGKKYDNDDDSSILLRGLRKNRQPGMLEASNFSPDSVTNTILKDPGFTGCVKIKSLYN